MNLTYEDCKELEDAGFSYIGSGPYETVYPEGMQRPQYMRGEVIPKSDVGVRIPTLSELIEQCGPWIPLDPAISPYSSVAGQVAEFNLHATLQNGMLTWHAGYALPEYYHEAHLLAHGATPEQAVKNLWIALNKENG